FQMDNRDLLLNLHHANQVGFVIVVVCVMFFLRLRERDQTLNREPFKLRDLQRKAHMHRILCGGRRNCLDYVRMGPEIFLTLATIMRDKGLLRDTIHVTIEEQLALLLHTVSHTTKNRFIHSREIVSCYFNLVLQAIYGIKNQFVQQASSTTHPEIATNPYYFPYFK
ncbi:hypothetical protein ACMD2_18919, partial [Ananas comosus]